MTLAWDANASTGDPITDAAGYRVYFGIASKSYTQSIDAGNSTTATTPNLVSGSTYYFAVTAYDAAGTESAPSSKISYTVP